MRVVRAVLPPAVALLLLGVAWETWVRVAGIEPYLLPEPSAVLRTFVAELPMLGREALRTAVAALAGFGFGAAVAFVLATLMAHSRVAERAILPLAVLVKVTPIIAVAPLLAVWFGFGWTPKLFIVALLTFFPLLVGAATGLRSIDPAVEEFFRSVHASRAETFFKLRVPSSLPYVIAAAKVSVTLAVIGAVVAEWFSGSEGLGRVVQTANNDLDMALAFAAILSLALIGIALYGAVALVERRVLRWHESKRAPGGS